MRYTISTNLHNRWEFITENGELTDDAGAWGVTKESQAELWANAKELLSREGISEGEAIESGIQFMIEKWED